MVAYGRANADGNCRVIPGRRVHVTLEDTNRETLDRVDLYTNDFGSVAGSFTIPAGHLLGRYTIWSSMNGSANIRVEEYKRPSFEVALDSPEAPVRLNRAVELTGTATYYFGLPVGDGNVVYRVVRTPQFPYRYGWCHPRSFAGGERQIAAGEAQLEADGRFRIRFTPQADESLPDAHSIAYCFRVTATLTDEGGESHAATLNRMPMS